MTRKGVYWQSLSTPAAMSMGPASVATAFDGTHSVFVASSWNSGLWRYVEP